jgi:ABC-type multidrug transport system permease subunit
VSGGQVAAIVLIGVFVVVPMTAVMYGLATLGACYSDCPQPLPVLVGLLWLVPIGYAAAAVRYVRQRRAGRSASPAWAWIGVAVAIAFSVLLAGCFALISL